MEQAVTAKIKIADSSNVLDRTMAVFQRSVQFCIDVAWGENLTGRRELHDACYDKIRERFGLQAQLACNAISQAFEMVKESRSKPVCSGTAIRYNFPRCASIKGDWERLSLATIEGRKKFVLDIPECFEEYLAWEVHESDLIRDRKGRFFFCFTFSKNVSIEVDSDSRVTGVDLGVNKVAVTSEGDFFGQDIKARRNNRDRLIGELQAKGTHAAHKRIQERGGVWKRFMAWKNHNISKEIVSALSEGDVLVLEDLSGIRETASRNEWVHKWAFRQLQQFLEYKATLRGVRVVYINPRNTSRWCSRCGSLSTTRNGGFFECHDCGFTVDADLNAARNIAHSYTETLGQAGSPVNLPMDSGTYECNPPSGFEHDSHLKAPPLI